MLAAYLGRQCSFKLGHFTVNPNQYIMLIGTPGARKSTAIKIAKRVITAAGYDKISADKSSKEKFMLDLAGEELDGPGEGSKDMLDANLWGNEDSKEPAEMYIACDEFNDFIGNGNFEFISLLGTMWDFEGQFKNRIKNGKSISVLDPTINILGGNTPVSFARAFPPEVLGQGFFSRLLLIYGEPSGRRITFPTPPSIEATAEIVRKLSRIKAEVYGNMQLSKGAEKLLDAIYQDSVAIPDPRFEHYSTRRFTHLLKLCIVLSAAQYTTEITESTVVNANTLLTHTESLMPKALGEFGKAKNSDITHKVMQLLDSTPRPLSIKDLWEFVHNDVNTLTELSEILKNLSVAGKIQSTGVGFLSKKKIVVQENSDRLDYSYLTTEEKEMMP